MSKKDLNLNKLQLTQKLSPVKPLSTDIEEQAIQTIHEKLPQKEKTKRITIDLPFSVYVDVKTRALEQEKTLKDFFISLIR